MPTRHPSGRAAHHPESTPGVAVRTVLLVLRGYKLLVSPLFAGSCRYWPSCSDYTAEAVRRHGVVAGSWLGVCRLSRCQPFGGSGYDPVPHEHPFGRPAGQKPRRGALRRGQTATGQV